MKKVLVIILLIPNFGHSDGLIYAVRNGNQERLFYPPNPASTQLETFPQLEGEKCSEVLGSVIDSTIPHVTAPLLARLEKMKTRYPLGTLTVIFQVDRFRDKEKINPSDVTYVMTDPKIANTCRLQIGVRYDLQKPDPNAPKLNSYSSDSYAAFDRDPRHPGSRGSLEPPLRSVYDDGGRAKDHGEYGANVLMGRTYSEMMRKIDEYLRPSAISAGHAR